MISWGRIALCAALGSALAGCGGDDATVRCADQEQYVSSRSAPPIIVPEDLSEPDRTQALEVPPGEEIEPRAEESTDPCLEAPPDFFENES